MPAVGGQPWGWKECGIRVEASWEADFRCVLKSEFSLMGKARQKMHGVVRIGCWPGGLKCKTCAGCLWKGAGRVNYILLLQGGVLFSCPAALGICRGLASIPPTRPLFVFDMEKGSHCIIPTSSPLSPVPRANCWFLSRKRIFTL